jgi:transcriptional regulator with XRE-family HTH domain
MDRKFPIILAELRKSRGLSQKEAAASLGISQALLSHYEKGIRECGQDFLLKAADYYGVSCDYLLGRTESPSGEAETKFISEEDTDAYPFTKTFFKASSQLKNILYQADPVIGGKLDLLLAVQLYRIIILNAAAGTIPKSWAGRAFADGKIFDNSLFLNLINITEHYAITPEKAKKPCEEYEAPEAIKTAVSVAEDYVMKTLMDRIPPIPPEYIK